MPSNSSTTSTTSTDLLTTHIETWLTNTNSKITSFWINAKHWNFWTRYELFSYLEQELGSKFLITHGTWEFWKANESKPEGQEEEIDILLDPRTASDDGGSSNAIAIKLRCEVVSENEGSFEKFRDDFRADFQKIKQLSRSSDGSNGVMDEFEGAKILLVGLSGDPMANGEDGGFEMEPKPKHLTVGDVHCWIVEYQTSTKTDEQ